MSSSVVSQMYAIAEIPMVNYGVLSDQFTMWPSNESVVLFLWYPDSCRYWMEHECLCESGKNPISWRGECIFHVSFPWGYKSFILWDLKCYYVPLVKLVMQLVSWEQSIDMKPASWFSLSWLEENSAVYSFFLSYFSEMCSEWVSVSGRT